MATVRISYYLKRQIEDNIVRMFSARLEKAKLEGQTAVSKHYSEIVKAIVPSHIEEIFRDQTARRYIRSGTYLDIRFGTLISTYSQRIQFQRHVPIPLDMHYFDFLKATDPKVVELNAILTKCMDNHAYVLNEQGTLVNQVKTVLNSAATLQQVSKAWPSILDFVDNETRLRFHEKVERKKTKINVELDETIKANLLKARIANDIT